MISPIAIVAYLALFASVGFVFLFVNLLVGKLLRPSAPNAEKLEIYECGEPTIGSSFVQFDLRFYVVALLFIIFDVEVAFFFPWAVVYGKAVHLMDPNFVTVAAQADVDSGGTLTPDAVALLREMGLSRPDLSFELSQAPGNAAKNADDIANMANNLALFSLADIGVFFAVLLVGFAYVWRRGDLDWVRAVSKERMTPSERSVEQREELVVS